MAVRVTCDWCAAPIDGPDVHLSDEELNRMGFEEGLGDHHIVVEARFSGTVFGQAKSRSVVAHYHDKPCYDRMLRLLHDQRRWAKARGGGPVAATTPKWDQDGLSSPAGVVSEHAVTEKRPQRPEALDVREAFNRRRQGTPLWELLSPRSSGALVRHGVATLEEAAECSKLDLLAIEYVGMPTIQQIEQALHDRGLAFRSDVIEPADFGARLRAYREAAGLAQSELRRELGDDTRLHHQVVGQWEAGRAAPTAETIGRIAAALGVSVDELTKKDAE